MCPHECTFGKEGIFINLCLLKFSANDRGQVEKLTAQELEQAIQEREVPLVIDFYATWCGPCLLLAKELEQVPHW
jgi:thioredoxin-like negative regulator of GroEL